MKVIPFIADSVAEAVTQIREKLGPDAVVVNVRQLPPSGVARLWQQPRLEVLAYKPEKSAEPAPSAPNELAGLRDELATLRQKFPEAPHPREPAPDSGRAANLVPLVKTKSGQWRVGALLETSGLMPLPAQRVMEQVQAKFGQTPPPSLAEELGLARSALMQLWQTPAPFAENSTRPHVFIGPAGVGKTTVLCKWLTQAVLVEGRFARVWRLDGATANKAESLSVYGEILGVETERSWHVEGASLDADIGFIDLPGVDWQNPVAIHKLGAQLKKYAAPQIHLVLNAAYDVSLLLAQLRAFEPLPVGDLIFTHLDEETRWGKLWNIALGTNYALRFFSAGQNIPGEFHEASAEKLLTRQFPGN